MHLEVGTSQKKHPEEERRYKYSQEYAQNECPTPSSLPLLKHFSHRYLSKLSSFLNVLKHSSRNIYTIHLFFRVSSTSEIAAIHVPQCNLRQNRGMVWNFTGKSVYVCITQVCVTDCQTVCALYLCSCVLVCMCVCVGDTVVLLLWSSPGKEQLISQCVGFCSRSGLNACYYSLSCCHPLRTAGYCPLCSLYRIPLSLKPGERSDHVAVRIRAKHYQSNTYPIFHSHFFQFCLKNDSMLPQQLVKE